MEKLYEKWFNVQRTGGSWLPGCFQEAQEPSVNIAYSLPMGQAKQWLCEPLTFCSPKGEGATSREQEQGDLLPKPLACQKALAKPLHFSVPQFPPLSVKGGLIPTSQGCCEV